MYCASCGALIDDASRFCPHCGMPTSEVAPVEADYAGLTIDAETGRKLGDTSYSNEPTRMLYDVPPATVAPTYGAASPQAESSVTQPAEAYSSQGYAEPTAWLGEQEVPRSDAYAPTETYTPNPSAYTPPEPYTPTPAYVPGNASDASPYSGQRQRSSSTMTIAISAAIGLVALLVIVLHLSGVAPWVQSSQTAEPATAEAAAEPAETAEPGGAGTAEVQPVEQPQAVAAQPEQAQAETYIMPDSDTHRYTSGELAQYDLYQLYLARNEIYARHGRLFRNQDLQDYFNAQSWYHGTIAPDDFNDEALLNEVERANTATMLQYEKDHNSPYLS